MTEAAKLETDCIKMHLKCCDKCGFMVVDINGMELALIIPYP